MSDNQRCSKRSSQSTVQGSKGEDYNVFATLSDTGNSCDCMGFQFRQSCKHVNAALADLCPWPDGSDVSQTPQQEMEMVCPACSSETSLSSDEAF